MKRKIERALFARVVIKREKFGGKDEKVGGIFIPKTAALRNAPRVGQVVMVGPTCDPSVQVGHWYVWGEHCGTWLNADGGVVTHEDSTAEFFVCQDEDLICEVKEE